MFLGTDFLGGSTAYSMTPTSVENIGYVGLSHGLYDDLYVTNDVDSEPSSIVPVEWDWNTIFHATFDGNTNAGNMDWSMGTVSHLLIKRKKLDEFDWTTIRVVPINSFQDFNVHGIDYFANGSTTYQYAVVPTLYGIDGAFTTVEVESKFDGIFIAEADKIFGTKLTDGNCDYTRNFPNGTQVTINNRYPTDVNTSVACYDTGSCSGKFIPLTDECRLDFSDKARVDYTRQIVDFLSDRKPKILKNSDGRTWLIKVDDQVSDNATDYFRIREISFNWTQIGDCSSEEDMYLSGLSDVSDEWWNA